MLKPFFLGSNAWWRNQFELGRGGTEQNLQPMEGFRGFAVFLVFLVHYSTLINPWIGSDPSMISVSQMIHQMGNSGVDLFFVLSGYLIYGSLIARPQPFGLFIARRIQRIYPAFSAVFAIYVGLSLAFPTQSKIPSTPVDAGLYLLANFLLLPGLFPIEPMITVAWSLSYEIFFYLLAPVVIAAFSLRKYSSQARICLFLITAGIFGFASAALGGPVRLIMFLSGMVLYEALMSRTKPRLPQSVGLLSLGIGLMGMVAPLPGSLGYFGKISVLFCTFGLACFVCFESPNGWLAQAFSWPPARWLGNMSYSYYLIHGITLKAAFLALGKIVPTDLPALGVYTGLLPIMFALTVLVSAILFVSIERPFSLAKPKRQTDKNKP